jgi:hypothetical protein
VPWPCPGAALNALVAFGSAKFGVQAEADDIAVSPRMSYKILSCSNSIHIFSFGFEFCGLKCNASVCFHCECRRILGLARIVAFKFAVPRFI